MPNTKSLLDISQLINTLKDCLSGRTFPVPLHAPCFSGREWDYVRECLDTGWVSSVGKFVDQFESKLAEFTGTKKVVATVNGTAALHTALKLLGVQPNDEVLVPALTFVATANAVTYLGAVPHFVDCEEKSFGVDASKLENYLQQTCLLKPEGLYNRQSGRKIKALIAVHVFGFPADLDRLTAVCKRFRIELVEDAAESLGSYYKGKHTGNWGKLAVLSFNGNKILTTGGGGAILTNDEKLARQAKHITTTARITDDFEFAHDEAGFNYRLPNINAALGLAQLEKMPEFLRIKRELANRYEKAFSQISGLHWMKEPEHTASNYWLNTLILDPDHIAQRNEILAATKKEGIGTRPCWTLMPHLPMYRDCPKMDLSAAESLQQRIINIPSGVK